MGASANCIRVAPEVASAQREASSSGHPASLSTALGTCWTPSRDQEQGMGPTPPQAAPLRTSRPAHLPRRALPRAAAKGAGDR